MGIGDSYMNMQNIFTIISLLTFIMAFGTIISFVFLSTYDFKTIEVEQPLPVFDKTIKPGGVIHYGINYCRYVDSPTTLTRELIGDTTTITLPSFVSRFEVGCGNTTSSTTTIPLHTPPGEYYLHLTLTNRVNAFQEKTQIVRSEKFMVIG